MSHVSAQTAVHTRYVCKAKGTGQQCAESTCVRTSIHECQVCTHSQVADSNLVSKQASALLVCTLKSQTPPKRFVQAMIMALFTLVATVALSTAPLAAALDHTHVDNHLNTEVVATLSYFPGESKFVDRHIPKGRSGAPTELASIAFECMPCVRIRRTQSPNTIGTTVHRAAHWHAQQPPPLHVLHRRSNMLGQRAAF